MVLKPLQEKDALDLALEISPKVFETVRKSPKERAFCYKLAHSLEGNPLALKLVFSALERSLTQSLSEQIISIWTEGFPGHIYEHSLGLKRHFDYLLSQSEDELSKMMMMILSPFKDRVPKDLSIYFDRLTALKALPERLPGSIRSTFLGDAESSQKLKIFDEMVKSVIAKLEGAGFVTNTDHPDHWFLHPLLPYILSSKSANSSILNTERVINAHAEFYMARAKNWETNSSILMNDLKEEYFNFISSFWRLSNSDRISFGTLKPLYLANLLMIYDTGDKASNPDMVVAVALGEEILNYFQKSSVDWECSLTANLIYRPSRVSLEPKMKEEEHRKHNCPCKPLIALIVIEQEVWCYHGRWTTDGKAFRVHLKRLLDMWKLYERCFDDEFHYQVNCGLGGVILFGVGTSHYTAFRLQEALESFTQAQKLLRNSLAIFPTFQDHLELCKMRISMIEMLLANYNSREPATIKLWEDEFTQLADKMWKDSPKIGWHDKEKRQKRKDSSEEDIFSIIVKDICEPGSQESVLKRLRKRHLKRLEIEMNTQWIPGQIYSKISMAIPACRLHDWKQAQRLCEDLLNLLDQAEFGSEMESRMMKFQLHYQAANAAISGRAYEAAIQHLQKGYDIMHHYRLAYDTRYGMFNILNMANGLSIYVSHQLREYLRTTTSSLLPPNI
jgi:hypothetical protein